MHGFATSDGGQYELYLINKYEVDQAVTVSLALAADDGSEHPAAALSLKVVLSMVEAEDGWGETREQPIAPAKCTGGVCELLLPALSFSRIKTDDEQQGWNRPNRSALGSAAAPV